MNIPTSKENADYEWATKLCRYLLESIGIWPTENRGRRKFFKTLLTAVSLTISILVCTIPSLCSLIVSCDDTILFIDNLGYFIPIAIAHLKFLIIYTKRNVLLSVVNAMAEDWAKPKTDVERAVMIRRARMGRIIVVFCVGATILILVLIVILPRFGVTIRYVTNGTDVRKTFPIPAYYIVDVYQTPYFEIILIVHCAYTWVMVVCYTGVDNFLGILIFHVCGQLENLRGRFASIKESKNFDRVLSINVEDHIRLIRTVDTIESTFSLLLLAELLHYFAFTCIYGLLLLDMLESQSYSAMRLMFLVVSGVNTSFQTLFYCIAGQMLETQSEGVYHAVYECDWRNLKSKDAVSLILVMMNAQSPLHITAGKLFPMTLLTFCNTLKVSLSYISVLITKL